MDALAALRSCTYDPTGATVAALTTSLPEAPGHDRQYDYRFSWLRDASLAVSVASLLGQRGDATRYLRFVHRVTGGRLDGTTWRLVRDLANWATAEDPAVAQPSHGIWEKRSAEPSCASTVPSAAGWSSTARSPWDGGTGRGTPAAPGPRRGTRSPSRFGARSPPTGCCRSANGRTPRCPIPRPY